MKSKITSIIMFFIIIAIIGASILIGLIVWQEISYDLVAQTSEVSDVSEESEQIEFNGSDLSDTIEKDIEVPEIRNNSNPLEELQESEETPTIAQTVEPEVNYENENVKINKYFYKQLNRYSQLIYNAFETNKENMKSGTYKVNLGSSFSSILSKENGQEELGKYYQSAIEAYVYDNPEVFYLSPSKMYLNIETTTNRKTNEKSFNTYVDCGELPNYFIDEFSSKNQVEQAIQKVESVRNKIISRKTGDTYSDIKMVHNYLVDNVEYDSSVSKGNIYNIYGALANNVCVCEGYAKALKYLLDELGVESCLVMGKATNSEGDSENHAWNYVKLDNTWYGIDSTWDDPVIIGGGFATSDVKYRYFLKGSNTINKDHFPSGKFTENGQVFSYPNLSSKDY